MIHLFLTSLMAKLGHIQYESFQLRTLEGMVVAEMMLMQEGDGRLIGVWLTPI